MDFYDKIAEYYDDIFIPKENQVNFIKKVTGEPPKKILDIACGTGSYAIKLAQYGYHVTGIDLDQKMIEKAKFKSKKQNLTIEFSVKNMLSFNMEETFDTIYCIGNSLVHLQSNKEIAFFLNHIKRRLKSNGTIIIQIINYDRIISQEIDHLPTIHNKEKQLSFTRNYLLNENNHKIAFNTELTVENQSISNTISLLPIQSFELKNILIEEGYYNINLYGDFSFTEYEKEKSYTLVLTASY
ncbi:class I SAM-dependent methyltransferase [Mycoplasmatota bacterium]|nr:class I SAM-dependent methyltransferase [Mycoplasmatota bacterium]